MSSNPVSRPIWLIILMTSDRIGLHSVPLPLEMHLSVHHLIHSKVKFNSVEFKKTIKVIFSTSYPLSIAFIFFCFAHVDGSDYNSAN